MADEPITRGHMQQVAQNPAISSNWKMLATVLDPKMFDGWTITGIADSHRIPRIQTREMLGRWLRMHAGKATVSN